ncbi:MAG: cytochrome P450 [Anderseniella sp.]
MRHRFSDIPAFQRNPLEFILSKTESSTSQLVPLNIGLQPHYLVNDISLAKQILKWPEEEIGKGRLVRKLRPITGNSSLVLNGPEHKRRRNLIHHQLARGTADAFVPQMCGVIRSFAVNAIKGGTIDVSKVVGPLALRMISVALFGHEALSKGDDQAIVSAVHTIEQDVANSMFRVLPPLPWKKRQEQERRDAAKFTMRAIVERTSEKLMEDSTQTALKRLDLNAEDLADELLTLLLAGHHTTASAAAWLIYHMAKDHSLAEALRCEAIEISDHSGEIDPKKLPQAKLSMSVVQEILRLYPPSWWFSREAHQDLILADTIIRSGTSFIISPWTFHRSQKHWDSPELFNINRQRSSAAFIPFGSGPRACVGMGIALMELQLLALELASMCDLEVRQSGNLKPVASLTLLPPEMAINFSIKTMKIARESAA